VVSHLSIGDNSVERGMLWPRTLFIGEGKREEGTVVPHVGDGRPTACRTGWTVARRWIPYPESLTGGARSGFQTWREPELVEVALFIGLAR
jgi:hypothetical protein